MELISTLTQDYEKYYWSKDTDGVYMVGSYDTYLQYGMLTIKKQDERISIEPQYPPSATPFISRNYTNGFIYDSLNELLFKIDVYLEDKEKMINQERNRDTILENTLSLFLS